jgi:DNA-binding HxlR family transcriptional regulator
MESPEGIATNVLADRLTRLEQAGLLDKRRDPVDQKRFVYTLTQKGRDTIPILLDMIVWGGMYDAQTPVTRQFLERVTNDRATVISELEAKVPRHQ